jgi:hypothetical protein
MYQGAPLQGGRLTFVTTKGALTAAGDIDETGQYKINAPLGEVKIGVDNRMINKQVQANLPLAAKKGAGNPAAAAPTELKGVYKMIPPKYYVPDTSGLTYTVTKDEKTYDIVLTD